MSRRLASLIVALFGFAASPALADGDLRPLCPDRPGKGTSPCTVDAGHFQLEVDAFDGTFQRSAGVTTDDYTAFAPTLKYGVSDDFDIEASWAPFNWQRVHDSTSGVRQNVSGAGDVFLRGKWNFTYGNDGPFAAVIEPFIKLPTARRAIGNGAVEGGLVLPLSLDLGNDFSLSMTPETDFLKNANGGGRHIDAIDVIGIGKAFDGGVTVGMEVWTSQDFDPAGTTRQYSFDVSAAWQPANDPDTQFDGGANFGLNSATPGLQLYAGISRRL